MDLRSECKVGNYKPFRRKQNNILTLLDLLKQACKKRFLKFIRIMTKEGYGRQRNIPLKYIIVPRSDSQ